MLEIDYDLFITNLQKTQAYCQLQMNTWEADDTVIDIASVFRSFNPEINGNKLFEFNLKDLKGTINPVQKLVRVPSWTTSPFQYYFLENLLRDQLEYKDKFLAEVQTQTSYTGDIIAVQIDAGYSESDSAPASYYLFDDDDKPPTDTWFYISEGIEGYRVLFAWIPDKYREYVDYAIVFNDLGCIDRFEKMWPDEYRLFYKKFSQLTPKNESCPS